MQRDSFAALLRSLCYLAAALPVSGVCAAEQAGGKSIAPTVRLNHAEAIDQDDLCFWRDAGDPSRSLIIASDKKAGSIAVYDLRGQLRQRVSIPKPGNIDIRQNVTLGGTTYDLVVVNQRADGWKLAVFAVDRSERWLVRLDRQDLATGPNYGLCLYHSRITKTLHAVITSEEGTMEQSAFSMDDGRIAIKKVRAWEIGKSEGAVADDELGRLYISQEEAGVWELGAEPDEPTPGRLVIRLDEHGLKQDLEGITLLLQGRRQGYLLLSSQGDNRVFAYDRTGDHQFVGAFAIDGAKETDGVDVFAGPFGPDFPHGVFGCHTAATTPCGILLTPWERIAEQLKLPVR